MDTKNLTNITEPEPKTIKNQYGDDVPVTWEQNNQLSGWYQDRLIDDPNYSGTCTIHCLDCGATWDRQDYVGGSIRRGVVCTCGGAE